MADATAHLDGDDIVVTVRMSRLEAESALFYQMTPSAETARICRETAPHVTHWRDHFTDVDLNGENIGPLNALCRELRKLGIDPDESAYRARLKLRMGLKLDDE